MRTCIKAWMSLNLGQIPPLTMELAALERLKNRRHHFFSIAIDPILFKLADNEDMHNILDEFEFRPDQTTDYGVSCPWASKKYPYRPYNGENGVSTFSLLFLIGSFWYLQALKLGWVWIFLNEICPWHIGLRWAIVALWATCWFCHVAAQIIITYPHCLFLCQYWYLCFRLGAFVSYACGSRSVKDAQNEGVRSSNILYHV